MNKAEILTTNRANERPLEGTLFALIQPPKLAVEILFTKNSLNCQGQNSFLQTEQMKGLMKELFMP